MVKTTIPYKDTGYFSQTMCDYLAQAPSLNPFYHRYPQLENFEAQIKEKGSSFSSEMRRILATQLEKQYKGFNISEATEKNISSLKSENTFTITTGHQLNLFTGPLYFLYKIISVINLSEELNAKYTDHHFVPVYWMATEDHDFDEINYFNFKGNKVAWNREDGGAVGELSTKGLQQVFLDFEKELKENYGFSDNAKQLLKLFKKAYLDHGTLTDATRYLGNELFKEYGLVIVDGNDAILKRAFIPFVERELAEQLSHEKITTTTQSLIKAGYNEQVYPREINLFYLKDGLRERIVELEGNYVINETDLVFTKDEMFNELKDFPQRFSPNALLRPLYQEVILPNLCYTGGGGELAYWFQLKDYFKSVDVPFPILLLRNSAVLVSEKARRKLEKLDLSIKDLFKNQVDLVSEYIKKISRIDIDFSQQRETLVKQFSELYDIAKQTDASFVGAVGAQEKKQLKGLDHLEKRLLKAQKRKHEELLNKLTNLQDGIFPKQSLQERNTNFAEFYLEYGADLIPKIKTHLKPLDAQFTILQF